MYIILVYDINVKRVGRMLKVCRQYLNWVQNSVFEGESTPARLKELKMRLKKIMKPEEDSVLIYKLAEQRLLEKEVLGQERNPTDQFL
jgi:CRISPR-associated protein Cas2